MLPFSATVTCNWKNKTICVPFPVLVASKMKTDAVYTHARGTIELAVSSSWKFRKTHNIMRMDSYFVPKVTIEMLKCAMSDTIHSVLITPKMKIHVLDASHRNRWTSCFEFLKIQKIMCKITRLNNFFVPKAITEMLHMQMSRYKCWWLTKYIYRSISNWDGTSESDLQKDLIQDLILNSEKQSAYHYILQIIL